MRFHIVSNDQDPPPKNAIRAKGLGIEKLVEQGDYGERVRLCIEKWYIRVEKVGALESTRYESYVYHQTAG